MLSRTFDTLAAKFCLSGSATGRPAHSISDVVVWPVAGKGINGKIGGLHTRQVPGISLLGRKGELRLF